MNKNIKKHLLKLFCSYFIPMIIVSLFGLVLELTKKQTLLYKKGMNQHNLWEEYTLFGFELGFYVLLSCIIYIILQSQLKKL